MREALIASAPAVLIVVSVALTQMIGLFYQTHYFDKGFEDQRGHFDKRFDDLRDYIRSEVKRLEDRIGRIEHPV